MKFIAMKTENGTVKGEIDFLCSVIGVTRQGFYEYLKSLKKPWKYGALAAEIRKIIEEDLCNDTYGDRRMHQALLYKKWLADVENRDFPDVPCEETVRKIMKKLGLIHKKKRNPNSLTKADKEARKADNLLNPDGLKKTDNFKAEKPGERCVTDITELTCNDGKLYISGLFDCFDSAVLGLSMAAHMRAELCGNTVKSAILSHPELRVNNAIFHSDRGSQYTSREYRRMLEKHGIRQSMNSAGGRCHDNAKCESMWARFKEELIYDRYDTKKMTMSEVKTLVWRYFMSYWNNRRICSANGGLPPMVKRARYEQQQITALKSQKNAA